MPRDTDTVPAQLRAARVTRREAEVLRALGDGLPNAAVATRLCISVRTVESHVGSLLAKLGVDDRRGLATIARSLPSSSPAASAVLPRELRGSVQGPPLVGREAELALLRRRLDEARRSERRVVVVAGEAGCGKSRLVAELAVEAAGSGATVLLGHCDQGSGLAYQPFVEAISALAAARPAAVGRADPVVPAELVHLVPALGSVISRRDLVEGGGRAGSRGRLFEGVAALLAIVAAEEPVLLVVEDLHRADEGTLHLLRHLVRRADRSALLVAVTVRGARPEGPALPIVDELRRRHGADVLPLGGLTIDDLAVLVLADPHLGPSRPGQHHELAAALWARTEGNPFLVAEVLRQVRADGPRALTGAGVPVGVRDLVATRLADLGEPVGSVLAAAAVVGRRFPLDVVAAAARVDEDGLVAAVERVERVGMVREVPDRPGWLEFTHDLVREAVEAELSAVRRRVLHRRVADALAGRGGALAGAVAQHLVAAEPRDEAAVTAAVAAAEEADRFFAYETAAGFYAAAGGLLSQRTPGPSPLRVQLLLREAAAHRRAGVLAAAARAARQALGLARDLGDPLAVADAALALTDAAPTLPSDPELPALVRQALSGLPPTEVGRRARLMARIAQSQYYLASVDERRRWSDRALTAARGSGDDATLATVLAARHAALWAGADARERLAVARELLVIAGRLDDHELALQGRAWEVVDRLELGDVAGADRAIAGHARVARSVGQPLAVRDGAL
jgi:DNA-binding CsgD family transcriptional regulator